MSKKQLSGWLTDYYSQGSEGGVNWAFMDAAYAYPDGKAWNEAGIVLLEEGDILTLFNPDDSVLWASVIEKLRGSVYEAFDNKGELALLKLIYNDPEREPYSSWMQKGVAIDDWLNWCRQKPPLRATLER